MKHRSTESNRDEYIYRVNRVIDYIDLNIDHELSLQNLSKVANFSEYHFHRIFKSVIKEPLNKYVQRIRIERAAFQLIYHPKKTITDIALGLGFTTSQFFSKVFKQHYETPAGVWRKVGSAKSKISHTKSNKLEDTNSFSPHNNEEEKRLSPLNLSIEVRNLSDMCVAYIRHIGPYKGDIDLFENLFYRLFKWAKARELLNTDTKILALYNDLPEIRDENKLRLTACITIPETIETQGSIGKLTIQGGKYAIARFEIANDEFDDAWGLVYGTWLPESGYQPEDKPAFELFHNAPHEHPQRKIIVDLCIPIKPL